MEISCQELQTTTICPENSSSSYKAQRVKILSEGEHLFFREHIFHKTMQLNLKEEAFMVLAFCFMNLPYIVFRIQFLRKLFFFESGKCENLQIVFALWLLFTS